MSVAPALLDDPEEWAYFGQPQATAAFPQQWVSSVVVQGMVCSSCALKVEDALMAVPGVLRAQVSAAAQRGQVWWDADQVRPSAWLAAVTAAGYQTLPARDAQARQRRQDQLRTSLWRWLLAAFCMMQVMMYAWPAYDAQPGDLALEYEQLLRWASWVICIPLLLFACGPFLRGAWQGLVQRRMGMELPVALGILVTFGVSTLGTFDPTGVFGQDVFFDSLSMFVCFLLTGRWLEARLRHRTVGALDAVLNRLPDSVERQQADGRFVRVAVRQVRAGDVVRILPGEAFPGDGQVLQGHTQVDEALLTGESVPLSRGPGDAVMAGSFNVRAAVQVHVLHVGRATQFGQMVELMDAASTQKPRWAQLADRVAGPFLLVVLGLAAVSAWCWWDAGPGQALMVAAAVLIVTCPCALSLATPVAMLTAAGGLAQRGVLVRQLQALERLAQIDTVVFDKTGTLTHDGVRVASVHVAHGVDGAWAQGLAAAVAQHSHHPVAQAVTQVVAQHGSAGQVAWAVEAVEECAGQGLRARVRALGETATRVARLGSWDFAGQGQPRIEASAVYLAWEADALPAQALAAWRLDEGLRPEAQTVVQQLRQRGLAVQLLSGDHVGAVAKAAATLGIADAQAGCTPQGKLAHLQALQAAGRRLAMVGDGLNDGPVLAGAHVALAVGRAVPVAQAKADVVLLDHDLRAVIDCVDTARRTVRVVRQNLLGAAVYNAASIPLAMLGWMPAWMAGLGMALSSLLVVLNAARLASRSKAVAGFAGPVQLAP